MSWVKLDDQFYWHAKVATLSNDAFRLFVGGLCLCNSFPVMAGVVLRSHVPMLFNTKIGERAFKRAVAELVTAGLWEECDEGWAIHDYADYQPVTKERREQLQQIGRLGGRPRKNHPETIEVSAENHEVLKTKPSENPARVAPVPDPVPLPESRLGVLKTPSIPPASGLDTYRSTGTHHVSESIGDVVARMRAKR